MLLCQVYTCIYVHKCRTASQQVARAAYMHALVPYIYVYVPCTNAPTTSIEAQPLCRPFLFSASQLFLPMRLAYTARAGRSRRRSLHSHVRSKPTQLLHAPVRVFPGPSHQRYQVRESLPFVARTQANRCREPGLALSHRRRSSSLPSVEDPASCFLCRDASSSSGRRSRCLPSSEAVGPAA
jgi:hypothetical protein